MTPVRIIILAALFYILYRLLFGSRKRKQAVDSESGEQKSVAQDILVEDPVCHTYVPKQQAVKTKKDGETYYFCSEKCCQTFLEEQGEKR
ncbi:MAG: YHS domain-containing protein [Desulfobulbaceae bacterium]|uniref:YHS domain-containing protein n=1 Tax=Candidatus Desulfobia pelagia TaxID=2841692 RepID=A0A8J6NG52_9BACT|nr:YHS domain-containing protein [Candidatus Desulfobia pelagia]